MKKLTTERILLISVSILAAIYIFKYYTQPLPVNYDKKIIEDRIETLQTQNTILQQEIDKGRKESRRQQEMFDSIQALKPKIKYVYVEKDREIDNSNVSTLVNEFDGVFSEGGIK